MLRTNLKPQGTRSWLLRPGKTALSWTRCPLGAWDPHVHTVPPSSHARIGYQREIGGTGRQAERLPPSSSPSLGRGNSCWPLRVIAHLSPKTLPLPEGLQPALPPTALGGGHLKGRRGSLLIVWVVPSLLIEGRKKTDLSFQLALCGVPDCKKSSWGYVNKERALKTESSSKDAWLLTMHLLL